MPSNPELAKDSARTEKAIIAVMRDLAEQNEFDDVFAEDACNKAKDKVNSLAAHRQVSLDDLHKKDGPQASIVDYATVSMAIGLMDGRDIFSDKEGARISGYFLSRQTAIAKRIEQEQLRQQEQIEAIPIVDITQKRNISFAKTFRNLGIVNAGIGVVLQARGVHIPFNLDTAEIVMGSLAATYGEIYRRVSKRRDEGNNQS